MQGFTRSYITNDRVTCLVALLLWMLYIFFSSQSCNFVLWWHKDLKTQWRNNSTIGPNNESHLLMLSELSLPSVATKPEINSSFPKRYAVACNYYWNNPNVYISWAFLDASNRNELWLIKHKEFIPGYWTVLRVHKMVRESDQKQKHWNCTIELL